MGRSPDAASWKYLGTVLAVLATVLGALAAILRVLGLFVHRAREGLIGSELLDYPEHELLLTGLDALWELPWRALSALVSSHPVLRQGAWTLLLLAIAIALALRWARRRRPGRGSPVLLGVASLVVALLLGGTAFLSIAVRGRNLAAEAGDGSFPCPGRLSGNWADQTAFESCSWLVNDTVTNEERRQSLAGLPLWLMAVLVVTGWAVHRNREPEEPPLRRRFRIAVLVAVAGVGLLVVRIWPTAHAYATWGLEYPPVVIAANGGGTGAALAAATAAERCCAYDVTDVAEATTLLLRGPGCPEALAGTSQPTGEYTVTRVGDPRVVIQGCG